MHSFPPRKRVLACASNAAAATVSALILATAIVGGAQAPSKPPANPPAPNSTHKPQPSPVQAPDAKPLSEEDLRRQLQGKMFYLLGGYSNNDLRFDMNGGLTGTSPQESYTLSMIQIDNVHLSKRQLQLQGIRYGVHFLGDGANEDPKKGSERLRITPKKKFLKIIIQREEPPKRKKSKSSKNAEQPAPGMTQADANRMLEDALKHVLSANIDQRMIASLPDYWQLYYRAEGAKSTYKPSDPSVLRQSTVDQKARLLTNFEPPSNEFAQKAGIVGVAQYHVVVGRDGKPGEIAVGRPIGFGLDENAVASIRKATFQPAMKGGQAVPVLVDLVVQFRIYSSLTGAAGASATLSEPEAPPMPGPYSASQTTKQP